jgi:hypothetical protein
LDKLLIIKLRVSGVRELIPNHAFTKRRNDIGPNVNEQVLFEQNENWNQDPNTGDFVFPFPDKPDCTVELPDLSATCPFEGVDEPTDWLENAHFSYGSSIESLDQPFTITPNTCTG